MCHIMENPKQHHYSVLFGCTWKGQSFHCQIIRKTQNKCPTGNKCRNGNKTKSNIKTQWANKRESATKTAIMYMTIYRADRYVMQLKYINNCKQ